MSEQATYSPRSGVVLRAAWQPLVLAVVAIPLVGLGVAFLPGLLGYGLLVASVTVFLVALFTAVNDMLFARKSKALGQGAIAITMDDPAPCFCVDPEGTIISQNTAAEARFGRRVGDRMDAALSGYLVNAHVVAKRQFSEIEETGQAREAVFTRNGHAQLTSFRTGDNTIWRVDEMGAETDGALPGMGVPAVVASQNGTILSSNDAMRSLFGRRVRSMTGLFGDVPVRSGTVVELDAVDGPVEVTVMETVSQDGQCEILLFPTDTDTVDGAGANAVFDALPMAALLVCADGSVESHNAAARKLLGFDDPAAVLKIGDLIEGPGRLAKDWMRDLMEDRASNRSEVVRMLRGGEERSVKISATPISVAGAPRILAVLQDAVDAQDLHTQFAQSQKMQAIGELAGGVAHDFNNLLTAITGHCDLLLLRHDQGDQDYADLVQIHQNANRAASLVGQLLAFSRKQTMKPELLDLRDTMGDLTHLLNRLVGERISLELSQDPALQPIWADRRLLDQVLMNLVVNARDAMPEGGPIRITSRMIRLEDGMQRNNVQVPPGSYVVIEVIDCGIGIPADRLGRIFEPFYTTKQVGEGTGLGLSMAYGIMKQSGGFIFCDSTEGTGTTFSLIFPAHDWPAEGTVPEAKNVGSPQTTTRNESGVILLVEDEAPVRAFASRALRLKGYSVLEAENGDEALDVLEDDELEIDVFVTDIIMPGKGGPEWVREALVTRPDVGVVFTSGYAEDAYGKFPDIPQAVFLAKPFSLAELTETVRQEMN